MELRCENCGAPLSNEPNEKSTLTQIYCTYCGHMNPRPQIEAEPPKPKINISKSAPALSNTAQSKTLTLEEIESLKVDMTAAKVAHFRLTFSEAEFLLFLNSLTPTEFLSIESSLSHKEILLEKRRFSEQELAEGRRQLNRKLRKNAVRHTTGCLLNILFLLAELSVLLSFGQAIRALSFLFPFARPFLYSAFFGIIFLISVLIANVFLYLLQPVVFLISFYTFSFVGFITIGMSWRRFPSTLELFFYVLTFILSTLFYLYHLRKKPSH